MQKQQPYQQPLLGEDPKYTPSHNYHDTIPLKSLWTEQNVCINK